MSLRPIDFANRYLHGYKVKGFEIVPQLCPICKGGRKRDKYTFAMNINTGAYNCKRGSCGVQGSFRQLCELFGEEPDLEPRTGYELKKPPQKTYKKPSTKVSPAQTKVEEYLRKRGFSRETWERRGVGEHKGAIAFPYYENGELVLMKFRPAKKVEKGERKGWREEGGKAVFWGMDDCDPTLPLVITEGEMDALALDEAGVANVVSVPSGAEDLTCVDNCWDWLDQFNDIVIWPDNDEPGLEMCRKLISRLGRWRCRVVKSPHKDANEHLFREGKESTMMAVVQAAEVPIAGLVRLADVKAIDPAKMVRVLSSIGPINQIVGGYFMGELSVWSGTNGSGKSTFLGQELLAAVDQGYKVCAYSGELSAALFRYWIDLQAAGRRYLEKHVDPQSGREWFRVEQNTIEVIRSWYRDAFFLYDRLGGTDIDAMFEVFAYAARRYDCKVFLVDNLMTTLMGFDEREYYRKQAEMVSRLSDFAKEFEAHVHLVAHPRKTKGRMDKEDVGGTGQITDLANNVFALYRVQEEDKLQCDTILDVLKCRLTGQQNDEIELMFESQAKRFYLDLDPKMRDYQFGWDKKLDVAV